MAGALEWLRGRGRFPLPRPLRRCNGRGARAARAAEQAGEGSGPLGAAPAGASGSTGTAACAPPAVKPSVVLRRGLLTGPRFPSGTGSPLFPSGTGLFPSRSGSPCSLRDRLLGSGCALQAVGPPPLGSTLPLSPPSTQITLHPLVGAKGRPPPSGFAPLRAPAKLPRPSGKTLLSLFHHDPAPLSHPCARGGGLGVVWCGVCGRVVLTEVGMLGCFISRGCI